MLASLVCFPRELSDSPRKHVKVELLRLGLSYNPRIANARHRKQTNPRQLGFHRIPPLHMWLS